MSDTLLLRAATALFGIEGAPAGLSVVPAAQSEDPGAPKNEASPDGPAAADASRPTGSDG